MIQRHWKLIRDPFRAAGGPFVATPGHVEAVARLVHLVESGDRVATLSAAPGLGKTMVLNEVLRRVRNPNRRVARSLAPPDGATLLADLARELGSSRSVVGASRSSAWRALADTARLDRALGVGLVLAVDDAQALANPADLDRLADLDPHPGARLTVLRVGQGALGSPDRRDWELAIRLLSLSRDETEAYVREKLKTAGSEASIFSPRAITRLHGLSLGVPRGIDRLASLALLAGAYSQADRIEPDLIDQVAHECIAGPEAA